MCRSRHDLKLKFMLIDQELLHRKLDKIMSYTILAAKNVLDVKDVCALTGYGPDYIYKLAAQGKLPHYYPTGRKMFFDRAEIEAWMKQNRVGTVEEAEQQAAAYVVTGKADAGRRARTPRVKAGKGGER